jgi:cephalosporin hydroxylase
VNISETIASLPAGSLWQHHAEFIALCEWIASNEIKSILEIGTGIGGSAYVFGKATGNARIVSVDFARRYDPDGPTAPTRNPNFTQILGDSRTDDIQAVIAAHGPFDLVYFDTEHSYENCVDNHTRYGPMASRYIVQHDINMDEENWPNAGIPRFWRELTTKRRVVAEFINPSPDPRFPRWGGLGVVSA